MVKKNIRRFLTIFVLTSVLTSCFGGEDDGTLGNWFIAILWILVWLKGGSK